MNNKLGLLLVDDENEILDLLTLYLELSDLQALVFKASDATSAIKIFNEERNRINVLITDIKMPGEMDGLSLARYLKLEEPTLKVVIITAHLEYTEMLIKQFGADGFIRKPFESRSFITTLENIIDNKD